MEIGNYKCSGKKYNGEKAIISLTSWKARINTVSKTLYSLLKMCPGFHIVLVLSEEEFPKMEKELPENLMLFVDNELIELLWVYKNVRAFKKIFYTMDKYRGIPIISADDDCIYKENYAQRLYYEWLKHKDCIITYKACSYGKIMFQHGPATLYCPNGKFLLEGIKKIEYVLDTNHDDVYYGLLAKKHNIKIINISKTTPYIFHDCICALSDGVTQKFKDAFVNISCHLL